MADASCFHNLKEGGIPRQLAEGLNARVFPGEHLMLSVVEIAPGSVSPVHSHPNEQWGVCLEGEWIRIQDGVEHHVKAGDFWQTPPHVPHGGRATDTRAVVLDIFSPPRAPRPRPLPRAICSRTPPSCTPPVAAKRCRARPPACRWRAPRAARAAASARSPPP